MRNLLDKFSALIGISAAHAQSSRPPSAAVTKPYLVNGVRFATLQAAFNAATPGSVVFASGTVNADPAVLRTANVTLQGPAKLDARGASAEGKALIVVKAAGFVAEEIEALNMAVADSNGAFIRMEANGDLTLRHCHVHDGQQGI